MDAKAGNCPEKGVSVLERRETGAEWWVTSQASFWDHSRRERPGIQLPFTGEFDWAGTHWVVPGVYSCGKALVVDFCRQVEPETMESFMKKWGLTPENDDTRNFTKEQTTAMEAENPMSFFFHPTGVVNGRNLSSDRGSATGYLPFSWGRGQKEGVRAVDHYHLDPSKAWHIWRFSFPWSRRREVRSLSFRLEAEEVRLPGASFQIQPGERVDLTHPVTGERVTLTAVDLERETIENSGLSGLEDWEVPCHCWKLTYTLEPALENFSLEDVLEGDQMRPRDPKEGETRGGGIAMASMASSVGIIGGADGPTALYIGENQTPVCRAAYSGLRFQPVETVTWMPVFREKPAEEKTVVLKKTG